MTHGLRWRIMVLQVGLLGIFGFVAGFAFWASSFVGGQVHDQLAAQQIYFPSADSKAVTSLPAADAQAMAQYAGQQMTTGAQAETYADHFIAVHLSEVAGGRTYAQVSTQAVADPTNATLAGEVQTLFRGETLRGLLLNTYGWWQIGQYALYAAVGFLIATAAVLVTFIIELVVWRREKAGLTVVTPAGAAHALAS